MAKEQLLEYIQSILNKRSEAARVELKKYSKKDKQCILQINNNAQITIHDDLTSFDEKLKKKVKAAIENQVGNASFKSCYNVTLKPSYYLSDLKRAETVDTICVQTITATAFTCYATKKEIDIFERANHGKLTVEKDLTDSIPTDELIQIREINRGVANDIVRKPDRYIERIGADKTSRRIGSEDPDFSFDDLDNKIRVFVLDTGIALHPDLNINRALGRNFTTSNKDDWTDINGHGTHVSGIIGGRFNNAAVRPGVEHSVIDATLLPSNLLQATLSVADARTYTVGDFVEIALFEPDLINTTSRSPAKIVSINGNVLTIELNGKQIDPIQRFGTIRQAAQASSGVAPNAELISYKVLRDNGSGSRSFIFNALESVGQYRQDNPNDICVVNMSIGGPSKGFDSYNQRVKKLIDSGVIFVVSAGNRSRDAASQLPAGIQSVLTVAAYDSANNQFARFSNFGPSVDIAAPGVSILNTWLENSFRSISGTSMAAPLVTGAVVNMVAVEQKRNGRILTQEDVKGRLIEDARETNRQSVNPFLTGLPVLVPETTNLSLYCGEYPRTVTNY
jgi:subtilisin family serine protease